MPELIISSLVSVLFVGFRKYWLGTLGFWDQVLWLCLQPFFYFLLLKVAEDQVGQE